MNFCLLIVIAFSLVQHNFKVDEGECLIGRCDENGHCVLSVRGAARCALCAPRPGDWSAWRVCVRWHCHICPLPCSSTTRKPSLTVTCLWVCSHMTCRALEVSIAIRLPLSGWQKMVAVLSEERGTRWRQKIEGESNESLLYIQDDDDDDDVLLSWFPHKI